ncbi:MAG: PASTA domain-containing protein [Microscillaceae bacterium]|nr:PASTA domain-containing protein [Microscillaceae bacterium]
MLRREASFFQTDLPKNQTLHARDAFAILAALGISSLPPAQEAEWLSPAPQKMAVAWTPRTLEPNKVPNAKGLSLKDAIYLLENKGLKVYYQGSGRVRSQSLMPGAALRPGDKIVIQLQ